MSHMKDVFEEIRQERFMQIEKWGHQRHPDLYWLGILGEEFGEVSKEVIEAQSDEFLRKEIVQTAAVCVAWLEYLHERRVK